MPDNGSNQPVGLGKNDLAAFKLKATQTGSEVVRVAMY